MSDTDDTDVLLLIPPDFFLVHTDSDDSYNDKTYEPCDSHCSIVNTLISHVHKLENRLDKIEVNSELSHFSSVSSCNSTIIPLSEMSEEQYRQKTYQNDKNGPSSSNSTPQRQKTKTKMTSLPTTPNGDKSVAQLHKRPPRYTSRYPVRIIPGASAQSSVQTHCTDDDTSFSISPEKVDNKKVLGEIDHFLSNVKTIQTASGPKIDEQKTNSNRIQLIENPVLTINDLNPVQDEADKRFNQLNLTEVNRLLQVMESQQTLMNETDQIESLFKNENFYQSQHSWKLKSSAFDLEFGLSSEELIRPTEELNKNAAHNFETGRRESDSQSNSEPTFKTVVENHAHMNDVENKISLSQPDLTEDDKYRINNVRAQKPGKSKRYLKKNLSEETFDPSKEEFVNVANFSTPAQLSRLLSNDSSINLFSLADIWKSNDFQISDKDMRKILPKLEEEKCRRKHCEKLIQELQGKILEMQQRLAVAVQADCAKDEAILKFHEAWEKVALRWKSLEHERNFLSQKLFTVEEKSSIDLAEAAQKVVQYEVEMSKALDIAHSSQEKCVALESERSEFLKQISELKLMIKKSEDHIISFAKERHNFDEKISQLEKESLKDKTLLLEMQNEAAKSKNVLLSSQSELSSLKDDFTKLQKKIKDKQSTIQDLEFQKNKLQVSLDAMQKNEQQIKSLQEESERAKFELRNFYQKQVELLVKDKLNEFQEQLEQAEKNLQDELQNREQIIAKTAAKQLQKLSEKHRIEIQLIEEKHKEEVRLYELQFNQMKQQINILQRKLESYQARRTNIAQELHNVMEQQWLQALRIINNGKSPIPGGSKETPELSFSMLRHILSKETRGGEFESGAGDFEKLEIDDRNNIKLRSRNTVTHQSQFCSLPTENFETPIRSNSKEEVSQYSDSELQKYIKLLLCKMPTNTEKLEEENKLQLSKQDSCSSSEFVDVISSWSQLPQHRENIKPNVMANKEHRSEKPPWK